MVTKIYANAVAKYLSSKLLGEEKLNRLIDAEFSDAVRMLIDYGYGGGNVDENSYDIDKFITSQTRLLIEFVESDCASENLKKILLNRFLYADAKVLFKAKFAKNDISQALYLSDENMSSAFSLSEYSLLPEHMAQTAMLLNEKSQTSELTSKEIDVAFTKAMHSDNIQNAKESKEKNLITYCQAQIDISNISSAYRAKKLNISSEQLLEQLYDGGAVDLDDIQTIVSGENATIIGKFNSSIYSDLIFKLIESDNVAEFLRDSDEILFDILKGTGEDVASYSPFINYFLAQLLEYKTIKLILVCVKNNMRDQIKSRIRSFEL